MKDVLYDFAHEKTKKISMINYPDVDQNLPFQKGSQVPTTHDALHPKKLAKLIDGNIRPIIELEGAVNACDTLAF